MNKIHSDIAKNLVKLNNPIERAFTMFKYAYAAITDPYTATNLSQFDDISTNFTMYTIKEKMLRDKQGREILKTQPRLNKVNIQDVLKLEKNTFGYKYAAFMDSNKFLPEERPIAKYMSDYETAYIKQRYKEIHDFVHVILGLEKITILNEIKVKYFEMIHFGLPSATAACFFGKALLSLQEIKELYASVPELARKAVNGKFIMNIPIEESFEQDFESFLEENKFH